MRRYLSQEHTVYWPKGNASRNESLVNFLIGREKKSKKEKKESGGLDEGYGAPTNNEIDKKAAPGIFKFNTQCITLAALIGLKEDKKNEDFSKEDGELGEITTNIFENHNLAEYIFFVGLESEKSLDGNYDVEIFMDKGEASIVKIFESYAAGGLELMSDELFKKPIYQTVGPEMFARELLKKFKLS